MIDSQYVIYKPILQTYILVVPLAYLIDRLGYKRSTQFEVSPVCWKQLISHEIKLAGLAAKELISQRE